MNKILHVTLCTALGAIGLSACDPTPAPNATVSGSVEPNAIPAGETLSDVVRATLTEMVQDEDGFSRARRLGALLPTLGPESVPTVEQMLADPRLALYLGATEVELLVRFWATHQPEDALRWAVEQSPSAYRFASVYASLMLWAEADPQAALIAARLWSQRNDVREAVQIALVLGWFAANDPPELEQFIRDLGIGFPQQRALSNYVRARIGKQGVEAVMHWAESVPDDDVPYKLAVYRQVSNALALFDLEAARRWCEAHADGPYGKDLRTLVAGHWLRSDGAAALEWLSTAPESDETNRAVRNTFAQWVRFDREAALGWMAAQTTTGEPDPWLRPTYPVYAQFLAEDSPADAIKWAEQTEDDADREVAINRVARAWFQVDEAAAEAWLLQSPLSEEAREKVRSSKGAPQPNR
jgi:hypothetical protein